jgi:hypothetical protein
MYTCNGCKAKKYQGWSVGGYRRYNELLGMVKRDREENKEVEERYLEELVKSEELDRGGKRRKIERAPNDDIVWAGDDFGPPVEI